MKEKDKNRKTGLSGFLSYRKDNLTNRQKNAFERELQKDPFAMEAEEGFSGIDPHIIRNDMELLSKKIKLRSKLSGKYILYRIAASVAVLMVVTTVFFMIHRSNPARQEKIAGSEPEALVVKEEPGEKSDKKSEAPPLTVPAEKIMPMAKSITAAEKGSGKSEDLLVVALADSNLRDDKANAAAVTGLTTADAAIIKTDTLTKAAAEPETAVQLQEITAGYGEKKARAAEAAPVSRSEISKDENSTGHRSAEPVNGMESFYKYIEDNIRRPDTLKKSGQVTVVISFTVKINGSPAGIRIIQSPGKPYSDEAVRLIKEGPLWRPAIENGVIKEEEVSIKIVFK